MRGVAHEEGVQLGGKLLHVAPGLLAQVVRAVGTLGEAEAAPEGQRRMIDSCCATRDLAEALPLGSAGLPQLRMAGEQAIDVDPRRERRIRRIPRDAVEAGQRSQAPGGVRAEVLLDSRSGRGDRPEPAALMAASSSRARTARSAKRSSWRSSTAEAVAAAGASGGAASDAAESARALKAPGRGKSRARLGSMGVPDWLLDSDPAIRWQVLRDLVDAPPEAVGAERARVATAGWGARLLALQGEDGQWAGGACFPGESSNWREEGLGQPWTSTLPTLQLLWSFGIDPRSDRVRRAVALLSESCRWEHAGQPFFDGEVEPCINGRTVALGIYFGQDVEAVVARLVGEQLEDGGWNCEAERGSVRSSFATTVNVLEGLLAHERATGASAESSAARRRGEEYLLERRLMRRRSTGEVVDPAWLQFSFPVRWHYDVLRALEYFRSAGGEPDPRLSEAIDLLRSKQRPDGTWLLENTHPGKVYFALEDGDGRPSRWNTLRALRVLRWYERSRT